MEFLQVSRRLNRRIKQALYEKKLGYVKIAVSTYTFLLKRSADEDARYSPSYFTKELIEQPDALVCSQTTSCVMLDVF
jgi:hypothetical protein